MNYRTTYFIYFFLCISFFQYSTAQEKKISLSKAILLLEKQHNVSFSYANNYIQKNVTLSNTNQLEKQLDYLERQTHLRFEKLLDANIIIRPFQSKDKIYICGHVKNNGFPEENISIVVKEKTAVITDTDGRFKLKNINYFDILLFYRDNFLIQQILAKELFKPNCTSIDLGDKKFNLEEVIVQNYLADGINKENQKIIVSPKNFKVLAGLTEPDVIKTIQQTPNASSPFETASQVYVRGSTPDQNLVLWNGVKTYNQGHFFGLLSAFNPYASDTLNFYNKGIPSKYGGRLASVIEINSNKKVHNSFSGNIGTNLLYSDAVLKVPIIKKKLSVTASARRSFTDLWKSPTYNSFSDRVFQNTKINNSKDGQDEFIFSDYSFGINAQLSKKDQIQVNGLYAKNNLEFTSQNTNQQFVDKLKTINDGYSFLWQHSFNSNFNFKINTGITNYLLDYKFSTFEKDTQIEKSSTKKNFINDFNSQAQLFYNLNQYHSFDIGLTYEENTIRYEFRDIEPDFSLLLDQQKNNLSTKGAFIGYQFLKSKKHNLQLGARVNKYSTDSTFYFEPRVYFKFYLTKHLSLNTSYNKLSQAVTQINESVASSLSLENVLWRIADVLFIKKPIISQPLLLDLFPNQILPLALESNKLKGAIYL